LQRQVPQPAGPAIGDGHGTTLKEIDFQSKKTEKLDLFWLFALFFAGITADQGV